MLQDNEKSRDLMIDQRFHKAIIGQQGAKIKEIRDQFNNVQISFPDPRKQSDVVSLRGPRNEVDKCYAYLQKLSQDMVGVIDINEDCGFCWYYYRSWSLFLYMLCQYVNETCLTYLTWGLRRHESWKQPQLISEMPCCKGANLVISWSDLLFQIDTFASSICLTCENCIIVLYSWNPHVMILGKSLICKIEELVHLASFHYLAGKL